MANKAIITVGLGFGDEGKGSIVDFLVGRYDSDLVVRYSGGCQAGHNVHHNNNKSHTFSQFGAGTFRHARTYLDKDVIVDPNSYRQEENSLKFMGVGTEDLVIVHPECLITTHLHIYENRKKERQMGIDRHGSCGLGIGETRDLWENHGIGLKVKDLSRRSKIIEKLSEIQDHYLSTFDLKDITDDLYRNRFTYTSDKLPKTSKPIIFEGAQGMLLDQDFGEAPHNTWSDVTPRNAVNLCNDLNIDYQTLGIIRWYLCRHGAGPIKEFGEQYISLELKAGEIDNGYHPWQGVMRYGKWDIETLKSSANRAKIDGLSINHLDQIPFDTYLDTCISELTEVFHAKICIFGSNRKPMKGVKYDLLDL